MNNHPTPTLFARLALLLTLSLTAACATMNTAPAEEKAGPQAPGAGFDAETQSPGPAPAAVTTTAAVSPPPAETAPASSLAPAPGRIIPRQKYVNVRPTPSTDNKPVAVLMGGKMVEVLAKEGAWVKIRWTRGKKSREGWVFGKFVETYGQNP